MSKPILLALTIITILLELTITKRVFVPESGEIKKMDIKINEIQTINLPNFNFENVYKRKVYQIDTNGKIMKFDLCHQAKRKIDFHVIDYITFKGTLERSPISYDMENIKWSKFVLDMYYDNTTLTVYLLFEGAMTAIIHINSKGQIEKSKPHRIQGIDLETKLSLGYFVKVENRVIFINNQFAILVNDTGAYKLSGYQGGKKIASAISMNDQYIVVALRNEGLIFYQFNDDQLQLVASLGSQNLSNISQSRIQLTGLAYYQPANTLLVLDQQNGLQSYIINISSQKIVTVSRGHIVLKKKSCSVMHLSGDNLYLVCSQVYKISLDKFPNFQQKELPHPDIKIKEISADGPVVCFIGTNAFRFMHFDHFIEDYKNHVLGKVIIKGDFFINANDHRISFGTFKIQQNNPDLTCKKSEPGIHSVVFETEAQCNEMYFKKIGVSAELIEEYSYEDTCIYTVHKDIVFWKEGKVNKTPILITLTVFIIVSTTVFTIWCTKKSMLRRLNKKLSWYTSGSSKPKDVDETDHDSDDEQKMKKQKLSIQEKKMQNKQ